MSLWLLVPKIPFLSFSVLRGETTKGSKKREVSMTSKKRFIPKKPRRVNERIDAKFQIVRIKHVTESFVD